MPGLSARGRSSLTAWAAASALLLSMLLTGATVQAANSPGDPGAPGDGVHAAAATHFDVAMVCIVCRNPPTVTAGVSFKIRVTAKNGLDQTLVGYDGCAIVETTDPQDKVIHTHCYLPADKGVAVFTETLRTVETLGDHKQRINVHDSFSPAMIGSLGVVVEPATASKMLFMTQPATGTAGGQLANTVVGVRDAFDNVAPAAAPVVLSLVAPAGVAAALTCTGGTSVDAPDGTATFTGCSVDHPGSGFRLLASSGAMTATSTPFDISEGPAATVAPSPSPSASASPSPSPTPGASLIVVSPLALAASASTVAFPGEVTLSVAFGASGAGRLVSIERRDAGASTWAAIGTVTTDAAGIGSLEYLPARTAEYRAVWGGDAGLPPQTSSAVAVSVKFQVVVSPSTKTRTTTPGHTLKWTATVRPKTAGITVRFRLYHYVGGEWVAAATTPVTTNAAGKAVYSQKFTVKGRWSVVITALAGPANAAGTAPRKYVTVK